jgi:hypothetical protein
MGKHTKDKRTMKNLKNEAVNTMGREVRSMKSWRMLVAFVLAAAFAALSAVVGTQLALADAGGVNGHTYDVTFTKWIAIAPNMVGVVGGDVGAGTYAGEILNKSTVGNITTLHALYHINGSIHIFTADLVITQDDVAGTAVITGLVTEGWLKGAPVTGKYTVMPVCPIATPGNSLGTMCFQGTLQPTDQSAIPATLPTTGGTNPDPLALWLLIGTAIIALVSGRIILRKSRRT